VNNGSFLNKEIEIKPMMAMSTPIATNLFMVFSVRRRKLA
jgi:hypothetical protein